MELECRYHGWRFGTSGDCAHIPQAPSGARIPRTAAVRAYPAVAEIGIVFVWFGKAGEEVSASLPIPQSVLDQPEHKRVVTRTCLSFLPYSYESLVENIADPGHVHFAHHGTTVLRREVPVGENFDYSTRVETGPGGVISNQWGRTLVEYTPPSLIMYDLSSKGFGRLTLLFHLSPAGHHRARFMLTHVFTGIALAAFKKIASRPRWLGHIDTLDVLDGDTQLLRGVDRVLGAPQLWKQEFGPPAGQTDRGPTKFRTWMDTQRENMPWIRAPADMPLTETMSVREMNDRLKNHTQHCVACTNALHRLERRKRLVSILMTVGLMGIVSGLMVSLLVSRALLTSYFAVSAFVVLLGIVTCSILVDRHCDKFIAKLTYSEYSKEVYLK